MEYDTIIVNIHLRKWMRDLSEKEQGNVRRLYSYLDRINSIAGSVWLYTAFAACLIAYAGYFFLLDGVIPLDAWLMHPQRIYRALAFLGFGAVFLATIYYLSKGLFLAAMVLYFGRRCNRIGEELGKVLATEPGLVPTFRGILGASPSLKNLYLPSV